ncbi:MAG: hypothetical protein KAT28_03910 [Candidatus Aenigmarchaeota archaeon]|nr:hypothetical protein [Candidatus Aenigmarchaeota archaeon]
MGIELITSEGKSEIDGENFIEYMQKLDNLLEPGTPIMLQKYTNGLNKGRGRPAERILFFSEGNLNRDSNGDLNKEGVFNLQEGKKNLSYVMINEKDQTSYQIVYSHKKELDNYNLNPIHNTRINEIIVGDILTEQVPDAMSALRFAGDAVYFDLHPFYSRQNYLIKEIGDQGICGEQETKRERQTHEIACLRASINLLKEAGREIGKYKGALVANQVGWFSDGTKNFGENKYPINAEDYLVHHPTYPNKMVAFVKTGKGVRYGETYILPVSKKMDDVVELAFSKDMIKEHYPHGF